MRRRRTMRAASALSEAWRDVASGTTRAGLFAGLFVLLALAAALADARWIVGLSQQAAAFRDSGASVTVLAAPGAVDARRCEALGSLPGVRAAGALRAGGALSVATAPRAALRSLEATPGMGRVLGVQTDLGTIGAETAEVKEAMEQASVPSVPPAPTFVPSGSDLDAGPNSGLLSQGTGVWVSADVADMLGAGPGVVLPMAAAVAGPSSGEIATGSLGPQRAVRLAGVYPYSEAASVRDPAFAVIAPVPVAGTFGSCWVDIWPPMPSAEALVWGVVRVGPEGADNVTMSRLDASRGTSFDGPGLFAGRPTRHAPWVAALAGGVVGALAVRLRRLEIAGNLHAGVPRAAQGAQLLAETLLWTAAGVVICLPVAYLGAWWANPDPVAPAWQAALRCLVAAAAGTLLGAVAASSTITEKRLLRYFKDR